MLLGLLEVTSTEDLVPVVVEGVESVDPDVISQMSENLLELRNLGYILVWLGFIYIAYRVSMFIYKGLIMKYINRYIRF